jgi:hypothetical protein
LQAVVSDGATFRSSAEYVDLPSNRPLYRSFSARVMFFAVRLFSGERPPDPTILDSIIAAQSTRLLLIAGGDVAAEVDYNELFAEKVGERATLWVAPDVGHTRAFGRYPDEYEQRVVAFFESALLSR